MTINEMKAYLSARYEAQAERYPLLRKVPKKRYIAVNLAYMKNSYYWKEKREK